MTRRATASDVARAAGVSQSAVSRVFTSGASASPAMAARVRSAADRLGYRPDRLAGALTTGRSRLAGLLVADVAAPFYAALTARLSDALQARGMHVLVFSAGSANAADPAAAAAAVAEMMDYRVDGIVAASVTLSGELVGRCAAAGLPVVLVNRATAEGGGGALPAVVSDNRAGAAAAARFLVAGGHRRIAHVAGWRGSSTGRDRAAGFRDALVAAGAEPGPVAEADYDPRRAVAAARAMLDGPAPPDAIFAANDLMALAVLDALRFRDGVDVPGDVSVVGYDDVAQAGWAAYRLTTVRQDVAAMVRAAVDALAAAIEGRAVAPPPLPARLVIRGSARLPEGGDA